MNARTLLQDVSISCLTLSPDNRIIAAGSPNGSIHIRDTHTMKVITRGVTGELIGHTGPVTGFCFDPSYADRDYQYALSCSLDKTVHTWDIKNNVKVYSPMQHPDAVQGMAISADGSHLACILVTNQLYIWTLRPGRNSTPTVVTLAAPATTVIAFHTGNLFATGDAHGSIYVHDMDYNTSRVIPTPYIDYSLPISPKINVMSFTCDGRYLYCGSTGPTIRTVDLQSTAPNPPFEVVGTSMGDLLIPGSEHLDVTKSIMLDESGYVRALTVGSNGVAGIWFPGRVDSWPVPPMKMGKAPGVVAMSRDGRFLVTSSPMGRSVILWDVPSSMCSA